jgi:2-polyprenyl-3-methyl-5-hydroxy-6-metoxy-1,4-benzoquinol methylase
MIRRAKRRAERNNLADRIDFRQCKADHLGVNGPVDFVLAFWVVHEVADAGNLFIEIRKFIKPDGQLLIVEPIGHVSASRFSEAVELAGNAGFKTSKGPVVRFSRSVVCTPNRSQKGVS